MKLITIITAALLPPLAAAPDGAQLFTTNCSACHMLDQMVVGPSLAEMRTLYNGKPDEFVKWCVAPGKKRPNAIEMPSMVHVGDEGLRAIYAHVMKVSEGVKEQAQKKGDPYAASPIHTARPCVQRIFMPNAGPAAIAVALDYGTSLCWDAGSCRLRYAWTGGFVDGFPYWRGNGSSVAQLVGTVGYVEEKPPLPGEAKFLGYSVKEGLPIFRYSIGSTTVTEGYSPVSSGKGFVRSFTLTPAPTAPLVLEFPDDGKAQITSDKGRMEGSKLTIPAADASAFTLTFSLK
ncbi:cytochrome c [Akkermansiaceae bacterium]|nr:cytochrome c [Akkermansiaceae bacterium]